MSRFFDKQGKPMSLMEWAVCFEDPNFRQVARTRLPHTTKWVSTIWMGLPPTVRDEDPYNPLIFETALFDRRMRGGLVVKRTTTEADAMDLHASMVVRYRYNRRQRRRHERVE